MLHLRNAGFEWFYSVRNKRPSLRTHDRGHASTLNLGGAEGADMNFAIGQTVGVYFARTGMQIVYTKVGLHDRRLLSSVVAFVMFAVVVV